MRLAITELESRGFTTDGVPSPSSGARAVTSNGASETLYVSGQVPARHGQLLHEGLVGTDVTLEQAQDCARLAVANGLVQLHRHMGDLEGIRVVRLSVYIAATSDFTQHSEVGGAASQLLIDVLGERGQHSRSALGVASLPRRSPVEIELIATPI